MQMMFKLNFSDPLVISPNAIQDSLVIQIPNKTIADTYFYSAEQSLSLSPLFYTLESKIRK